MQEIRDLVGHTGGVDGFFADRMGEIPQWEVEDKAKAGGNRMTDVTSCVPYMIHAFINSSISFIQDSADVPSAVPQPCPPVG